MVHAQDGDWQRTKTDLGVEWVKPLQISKKIFVFVQLRWRVVEEDAVICCSATWQLTETVASSPAAAVQNIEYLSKAFPLNITLYSVNCPEGTS